jgi:hypothetical protein
MATKIFDSRVQWVIPTTKTHITETTIQIRNNPRRAFIRFAVIMRAPDSNAFLA